MKLDEYIQLLQNMRLKFGGDIRVVSVIPYTALNAVGDPLTPCVGSLQVKTAKERYEKLHSSYSGKEDSGIKVIVL